MDRGKYVMSVRNLILSIIDQSKELKSLELELSKTNNFDKIKGIKVKEIKTYYEYH